MNAEQAAEIVAASRIAMNRPEQDGFWDRLAGFFEQQRVTIQPRPMKEL